MDRFFVLLVSIVFLAIEGFCDESLKNVRVGYFQRENYQEGSEGTSLYGYFYEYYQRVAQYTGWRYEYVFGTREELYQKFLKGDVDLMAGFAYSKELDDLMDFPKIPMGREVYHFLKKSDNGSLVQNPVSWRGKRFGVIKGNMNNSLRRLLEETKIDATVKVYNSIAEQNSAFYSDSVDAILVENMEMKTHAGVEAFFRISNSMYYLCVSKNRPDLLGELNRALAQLMEDDPIVTARLYNKYLKAANANNDLTPPERAWIMAHDTLRVGYLRNMLPYSDDRLNDEDAESDSANNVASNGDLPSGIIGDIIPEMTRRIAFKKLVIKYKGYDAYENMIADIARGKQDLVFPVGGHLYWAEKKGIYESAPVVQSELDLVFKGKFSESVLSTFAVNSKSKMMEYYIRENFPNAQIRYYNSIEECLDAIQDGAVTATVIGNLRTVHILKNRKYSNLSTKLLNIPNDKYFGVAFGNEVLLKLTNRGLALIGDDFALNATYKYARRLHKYDLLNVFVEHSVISFGILFVVFLLVVLVLVNRFRRIKKQAAKEQVQNERLNMQLDVIKSISDLYHSVFLVNVPNNSFEIIHTFEVIEKAVGKYLDQAQTALDLMTEHMIQDGHKPAMRKFNKISDWPKVLANQDSAYEEYEGLVQGWSGVTIIVARRDENGVPTHVLYISQEINRQKKAELNLQEALAQAEHANNAKTFFLNNMSHDIRTPMNAIIGFASLAATHIDDKERLKDYLGKISISSEHLLSLINDVLDMRRIESGNVKLDENDVHLPDVLHDVKAIVQTNALRKQQDLFIDAMDVENEDVVVDKLRLNQILLNLLSNAIKFTRNGGTISLRVIEKPCKTEGYANFEFRVKDNGIGISPEFQNRIFDAFSREETSTVSGIQGTGLGMAITKNIVNMMGGDIRIVSDEGVGTEFIVALEFKLSGKTQKVEMIPQLQGLRALVVDDDSNTCLSVSKMLREIGMCPEWTTSGKEAVVRAQDAMEQGRAFSTYIVDWLMPDMNGIETIRRIRKVVGDRSQIVVLTAYDWSEIEQEAREAGVTAFCSKPLFMSELRNVLLVPYAEKKEKSRGLNYNFDGARILLAEDNLLNQEIAVTMLSEAGFVVDVADNGAKALRKMQESPAGTYKLILMDIQMPVMDGYQATSAIRKLEDPAKANVPIVAMTANAFDEDRMKTIDAGMNDYLPKPVDVPKLMETLMAILGK